eukprot:gb/GFBE01036387.1/.p1 GENE.gb/GFBE01036387.1/~~gb/GFBE01036387.1/.p1  ORF type:complete len:183 (+),score=60.02 gb/GFBE01036387.1/:1-549(+)
MPAVQSQSQPCPWFVDLNRRVQEKIASKALVKESLSADKEGGPFDPEADGDLFSRLELQLEQRRKRELKLRRERHALEMQLEELRKEAQIDGESGDAAAQAEVALALMPNAAANDEQEVPKEHKAAKLHRVLVDYPGGSPARGELEAFLAQRAGDGHLALGPDPQVAAEAIRAALGLPPLAA